MASESKNRSLWSFSFFILLNLELSYSRTLDKLVQGQELKDGDELVSALGIFRLGFFSPLASTNRYLGIWYFLPTESSDVYHHLADGYYQKDKPVWVANRDDPISDKSGKLIVDSTDGNLKIVLDGGDPIAISSVQGGSNRSAILLQSGNLVLQEMNSSQILWQSFDYPTDTLLPGMKLGINYLQPRHEWFIQSWTGIDSPAKGEFTLRLDPNVTKRLKSCKQGEIYWNSGLWLNDRLQFDCSADSCALNGYYNFRYTSNKQESYFNYSVSGDAFPVLRINPDGAVTNGKGLFLSCTRYGGCWKDQNQVQADLCGNRSFEVNNWLATRGFMSAEGFKFNQSDNMNYPDCQAQCIKNCSCVAFAPTASNFTGCEIWSYGTKYRKNFTPNARFIFLDPHAYHFPDLFEEPKKEKMLQWLVIVVGGPLLVIFLSSISYLLRRRHKEKEEKPWKSLIIAIGVPLLITPLCYLSYWILGSFKEDYNRRKLLRELASTVSHHSDFGSRKRKRKKRMSDDLRIFNFQTLEAATNNFSAVNKIGEGGFGPVYKGQLGDGQVMAVKRLSTTSRQGLREFKNEVKLIAKLQHTNLVKLLGCSIHREERVLVYEHMPNRSLDFFIFNSERKKLLNWKTRFNVIEGIAQGLLYLHKYSRLKVVHRDLKAHNVLLDDRMNPKISDFGMARLFGVHESEKNTNRIVGTYGYMSPEYAMSGIVSTKTDVYSFGVLVLEIVSSKKNTCSYHSQRPLNLIGYAWQLWNDGRALELMDPEMDGPSPPDQVLRCIHVGLLCVQDQAADRPTMYDIVSMLKNETTPLPASKQPAFYINVHPAVSEVPENDSSESFNEVTITMLVGR